MRDFCRPREVRGFAFLPLVMLVLMDGDQPRVVRGNCDGWYPSVPGFL
jgi:hypothetical protein